MDKIRSFIAFLTFPIRCPFILAGRLCKSLIDLVLGIKAAIDDFRTLNAELIPEKQLGTTDPQKINFYNTLKEWGIGWEDIPHQITAHRAKIFANALISFFGILMILTSCGVIFRDGIFTNSPLIYLIGGSVLIASSLTSIVLSLWRLNVYSKRRFIPFSHWLKGRS